MMTPADDYLTRAYLTGAASDDLPAEPPRPGTASRHMPDAKGIEAGDSEAQSRVLLETEIARRREGDRTLRLHALILDSIHAAVVATNLEGQRRETRDGWVGDFLHSRSDGSSGPADLDHQPLLDEGGKKIGTVTVTFDGTERKREQEKAALLVRELHHRLKNTLATVLAIMRSTGRTATTIEDFQRSFAGRVESLAKTHALLAEHPSEAVDFNALLEAELGPYRDGSGRRIRLSGPSVSLPSAIAVPVALALHELATNAAKYGSLSNAEGWLEVSWTLLQANDGARLVTDWSERGGAPAVQPAKFGFGSELLRRVLRGQIGADLETSYASDGLRLKIGIPVPRV